MDYSDYPTEGIDDFLGARTSAGKSPLIHPPIHEYVLGQMHNKNTIHFFLKK